MKRASIEYINPSNRDYRTIQPVLTHHYNSNIHSQFNPSTNTMAPTDNSNPGNFANRPKDEVSEIASKGGQTSHSGGFASMDPDKQVGRSETYSITYPLTDNLHSAILLPRVATHRVDLSNQDLRRRGRLARREAGSKDECSLKRSAMRSVIWRYSITMYP
jgi:general stress protein YciG